MRNDSIRHHAVRARPNCALTVASLVIADVAVAALSVSSAAAVTALFGVQIDAVVAMWAFSFIVLAPISFSVAGVYPGVGLSDAEHFRRTASSSAAIWFVLIAGLMATGGLGAAWLGLVAILLSCIAFPFARATVRRMGYGTPWWGVPTVVVGTRADVSACVGLMRDDPRCLARPVAVILDGPPRDRAEVAGVPVWRKNDSVDGSHANHAVLLAPHEVKTRGTTDGEAGEAADAQAQAKELASEFSLATVVTGSVDMPWWNAGAVYFGLPQKPDPSARQRGVRLALKRAADLALLVPTGLVAFPIVGLAALAVRMLDRGDPFYTQERMGKDGETFEVLKLRTMYVDAEARLEPHLAAHPEAREEWNRTYKLKHDVRILPGIGHFLRASSLDELPQLWNIYKGEMSFVGPRPFPVYHLEAFGADFRRRRTEVTPGLTGLWQISARSDSDVPLQEALDTQYIDHWSLWLDILILLRTPKAVLSARGAR